MFHSDQNSFRLIAITSHMISVAAVAEMCKRSGFDFPQLLAKKRGAAVLAL